MSKIYQKNILSFKTSVKRKFGGFTLIELLVVVLIIGILAAIALPQYEKAVEKSRMSEAILAVQEIANANKVYYMANGEYSSDINNLDVQYGGQGRYSGRIPAAVGKYFIFSSTASGLPDYIALVSRRLDDSDTKGAKVYSLAIDKDDHRVCFLYGRASDYQRQLCEEWAEYVQHW